MAIPIILPTLAPNAAAPSTEAATADKARRPIIPVITAVQPYVAFTHATKTESGHVAKPPLRRG